MAEITRRDALKITGATAVAATLPIVNAATAAPSPELLALYDDVLVAVGEMEPDEVFARAQHTKIFNTMHGTDGHCEKCDARLEDEVTFVHGRYNAGADAGQRFVYRIPHKEVELAFAINATADKHAADKLKGEIKPFVLGLIRAFKEYRELDAASVFNAATTYDLDRVGDGKPLCSAEHPCDDAMWSNQGQFPLTAEGLKNALLHIRTSYVDEANIKILARGRRLVVPVVLMDEAYKAVEGINQRAFPELDPDPIVWDYLENDHNWFLLTDIAGLHMSERRPFRMRVEMDVAKNAVIVMGDEKRGFGNSDPRAVFGSIAPV